jgi:ABC-type ATPase involved in cell division
MIRMTEIVASGLDMPLTFTLPAGLSAAIHTSRELENDVLVRLLLGFQLPEGGSMMVNDVEPASLKESQLTDFRRNIGVIYNDGGLISNLNVWDNLTLQHAFFSGLKKTEIEARGRAALERIGYNGSLTVLPNRLSLFERRLLALARAMLNDPDLLICQSALDGLSREEQKLFCRIVWQFFNQGIDRTALFITTYPDSLKGLELDFIYNTGGSLPL